MDAKLRTPLVDALDYRPKVRRQVPFGAFLDTKIIFPAIGDAFRKLDPRILAHNPVIFVVAVVAALTTVLFIRDLATGGGNLGFSFQIILWLWFTVLFANFAEAVAEGRGKAQAASLRQTKTETRAKLLADAAQMVPIQTLPAVELKPDQIVLVEAGDIIPSDGEVIEGVASVNEAAITGESAPVIRESGGDRSAVTGGTLVISDWIKVRITAAPGSTFLDRMIALVEGAERQKTPNEIALNILLAGMTIIFILAVATIPSFAAYAGGEIGVIALVALFVTLIPTTIGALLSAIGIAGMDRLVRFNVLAMSGRAVEAAGDVDTLLLDKTGTITLGNRQASEFLPLPGIDERDLAEAAQFASLSDETPEGRSIVVLAKQKFDIRGHEMGALHAQFVPFTAQSRMSGLDMTVRHPGGQNRTIEIRKGAAEAIMNHVRSRHGRPNMPMPKELERSVADIAKAGGTPLVVARDEQLLGVIALKDIVKGGIRERFAELREMGIRTVMITGDNPMTAAAIAAEAGVDDLSRRSHAGSEAAAHPRRTAEGQAGRHVRRRHQRRPRLGAGGCRGGDEYRHHGRARGRQHGRPRQRSHQADRDRRHRQTAADDPRRADHVLHRQRRGQVFRDHSGDVHRDLSLARRAQHHAPGDAAERHPVGDHLQRADHHRADPARHAWRPLLSRVRQRACCAATF